MDSIRLPKLLPTVLSLHLRFNAAALGASSGSILFKSAKDTIGLIQLRASEIWLKQGDYFVYSDFDSGRIIVTVDSSIGNEVKLSNWFQRLIQHDTSGDIYFPGSGHVGFGNQQDPVPTWIPLPFSSGKPFERFTAVNPPPFTGGENWRAYRLPDTSLMVQGETFACKTANFFDLTMLTDIRSHQESYPYNEMDTMWYSPKIGFFTRWQGSIQWDYSGRPWQYDYKLIDYHLH